MTRKTKLLTIIITTFNSIEYIHNIINLIRSSNDKNIEIIVVDDSSSDDTINLLSKIKSDNLIILQKTENLGLSHSRNLGMSHSSGDFIVFLDDDDQLLINKLIYQLETIEEETSGEFDFIEFDYNKDYDKYMMSSSNFTSEIDYKIYLTSVRLLNVLDLDSYEAQAWKKIYRREFLFKNGIAFCEGIFHEDELWNFYVYTSARLMVKLNSTIYFYNTNYNSITISSNHEKVAKRGKDIRFVAKKCIGLLRNLQDQVYFKAYSDYFSRIFMFSVILDSKIKYSDKFFPIKSAYRLKTIIKSLIFLIRTNLFKFLSALKFENN